MRTDGPSDNRIKQKKEPGNVVDLTELLRKRREERERQSRLEEEAREAYETDRELPEPEDEPEAYGYGYEDPDDFDEDGGADEPERTEGEEEEPEEDGDGENRRRGRRERPKKSLRTIIGDIFITLLMLIVCLLAAAMIASSLISVEKIDVTGNVYLSDEPIREWYFPTEKTRLLSRLLLRNVLGRKPAPALSGVRIVLTGLKECEIRADEKEAAFTIAMAEDESVLILTPDGEVLQRNNEKPEHLPLIEGIRALTDEPLLQPETDQPETFLQLLSVFRILSDYEMDSDSLYIRDGSFWLDFGDVHVCLGTDAYFKEKLTELQNQIPAFEGLKGTLHLEKYDGSKDTERFTFEVDP